MAGVMLIPLMAIDPPGHFDSDVLLNLAGLAFLSSAVAYLLYYRLLADVGPSKALTVTFLIPAFAMLWGAIFLDEAVTASMLVGTLVIIAGTLVVTRTRVVVVAQESTPA
jgi:drug/metabolite transporter (DMT)-like permease